jgi:hypothetical protein
MHPLEEKEKNDLDLLQAGEQGSDRLSSGEIENVGIYC